MFHLLGFCLIKATEKASIEAVGAAEATEAISPVPAAPLEKPKRRGKMPTAADTADAAAAATAAAAMRKTEEEAVMLTEMTRITKVLDEKLDVLDAFEIEARLRLSGVEQAVRAVERIAASRRVGGGVGSGVGMVETTKKEVVVAPEVVLVHKSAAPAMATAAPAAAATTTTTKTTTTTTQQTEGETKERLNSLLSSLSLLEKSLDVLYFLEFETVNEEAQIKRLINIADKIHSHAESK